MVYDFHTEYIMNICSGAPNPIRGIGLSYVRFAAQNKNFFKFLFQSDHFSKQSLKDLTDSPALHPVLEVMSATLKVDMEQAKECFAVRFLTVHGMASMLANNSMVYDEKQIASILKTAFD